MHLQLGGSYSGSQEWFLTGLGVARREGRGKGGQVDGQILHLGSALDVSIPGPQRHVSGLGVTYGSGQEFVSVLLEVARRPESRGRGVYHTWARRSM